MTKIVRAGVTIAIVVAFGVGVLCGAAIVPQLQRPVVDSALGCVDTVATRVAAPTSPSMAEGGGMDFRDDIAPGHGVSNQPILGVYLPPGSDPTAAQGDRVRVCLLSMPEKTAEGGPGGCNPATDVRGRVFLVLDLGDGAAGVFTNGEHGCGGA